MGALIHNSMSTRNLPSGLSLAKCSAMEGVMDTKTLENLFPHGLKDIYYAEKKILRTLPKMAKGANSPELKAAFQKHRDQTEGQVERLEQVFELLGRRPQGKTCPAIDGIIEEGQEILEEYEGSSALDAGLLAAAQAVEHYEITRYGTLRRWAQLLGMREAADLFAATLQEESQTDEELTALAEKQVNQQALNAHAENDTRRGVSRGREK
jgi:ferritin-like metal-binding protein YciE